jgi:predicted aspartyl protease
MGVTNVKAIVGNPADSSRRCEVEFLVDSGATYSLVPSEILSRLEIEPHSVREFVLGNGEFVTRKMGTATFEYLGVRGDSLVMFGEPGDSALLGATTLEGFGLILDPFRRELKPLPMHFNFQKLRVGPKTKQENKTPHPSSAEEGWLRHQ